MGIIIAIGLGIAALGSGSDGPGPRVDPVAEASPRLSEAPVYTAEEFTITDGNTVRIRGARTGTRLVGFNTPETFRPRCDAGLALGERATARLEELVRSSDLVELRLVPCACRPGTEGTDACNFGRSCGVLTVDGRDVGDILISEGLAARFQCGRTSCPPTPRPWCE
jgi:endonuclease YncB( thermonuclease family)